MPPWICRFSAAARTYASEHSSVVRIAADAIPSPQRHVQHVGDDAVHGALEERESLAGAFQDGRDEPASRRELLDERWRDVGAGRRDADPVSWTRPTRLGWRGCRRRAGRARRCSRPTPTPSPCLSVHSPGAHHPPPVISRLSRRPPQRRATPRPPATRRARRQRRDRAARRGSGCGPPGRARRKVTPAANHSDRQVEMSYVGG